MTVSPALSAGSTSFERLATGFTGEAAISSAENPPSAFGTVVDTGTETVVETPLFTVVTTDVEAAGLAVLTGAVVEALFFVVEGTAVVATVTVVVTGFEVVTGEVIVIGGCS